MSLQDGTVSIFEHSKLQQNGFGWFNCTMAISIDLMMEELHLNQASRVVVYDINSDEIKWDTDPEDTILESVGVSKEDVPWFIETGSQTTIAAYRIPDPEYGSKVQDDVREVVALTFDTETDTLMTGTLHTVQLAKRAPDLILDVQFSEDSGSLVTMCLYPAIGSGEPRVTVFCVTLEGLVHSEFRRDITISDEDYRAIKLDHTLCSMALSPVMHGIDTDFLVVVVTDTVRAYCVSTAAEVEFLNERFESIIEPGSQVTIIPGPENQLRVLFYKASGAQLSLTKLIDNSTPIDVAKSQRALPPQLKSRLQHRHMLKERGFAGTRDEALDGCG